MRDVRAVTSGCADYSPANTRDALSSAKREAMIAAKDLDYGDTTIERIRNANSIREVGNIMKTARRIKFND